MCFGHLQIFRRRRFHRNVSSSSKKWNYRLGRIKKSNNVFISHLTLLRPKTCAVSIMTCNNEIGVIQPIREIGQMCRDNKVFFHTDAAQAVGKIPLDVNKDNIDLMSISAHKIYGPKGIGALYVRRKHPRVRILPLITGGGQERGLRSGTLPAPLCIGFGEACQVANEEMQRDLDHVTLLSDRLYKKLKENIPHIQMNGDVERRYPGNLNISFAFVEGESLLMSLSTVALSSGSACTSASLEPSYVLKALGVDEEMAHTSLRFGIGRFTTEEEIDYVANKCIEQVSRLRELSPLYEMFNEGIDLKSIKWSEH
jgi:cysteine desulfurase